MPNSANVRLPAGGGPLSHRNVVHVQAAIINPAPGESITVGSSNPTAGRDEAYTKMCSRWLRLNILWSRARGRAHPLDDFSVSGAPNCAWPRNHAVGRKPSRDRYIVTPTGVTRIKSFIRDGGGRPPIEIRESYDAGGLILDDQMPDRVKHIVLFAHAGLPPAPVVAAIQLFRSTNQPTPIWSVILDPTRSARLQTSLGIAFVFFPDGPQPRRGEMVDGEAFQLTNVGQTLTLSAASKPLQWATDGQTSGAV